MDPDFAQHNLIIKSGVGNYRLLDEAKEQPSDLMLSLTKAITDTEIGENVYEVVTNKCARVCIREEALINYIKRGMVAGCELLSFGDEDEIMFCNGVDQSDYIPNWLKDDAQSTGDEVQEPNEGTLAPVTEKAQEGAGESPKGKKPKKKSKK